jgi:hypothetical protein
MVVYIDFFWDSKEFSHPETSSGTPRIRQPLLLSWLRILHVTSHLPSPVIHSVHFYDHDEVLIARLSNIIASAVETGNSVLIVATQEHRSRLVKALEERLRSLSGP